MMDNSLLALKKAGICSFLKMRRGICSVEHVDDDHSLFAGVPSFSRPRSV